MTKVSAIIPAAGQGKRMGGTANKQFLLLGSRPLLLYTLTVYEICPAVDEIIPVLAPGESKAFIEMLEDYYYAGGEKLSKITALATGGAERQDSVYNALGQAQGEIIAVHDGARPLITADIIEKAIEAARQYGAAAVGVPAKNTIKVADADGIVVDTPPRETLWEIQTPQVFRAGLLREAYEKARAEGFLGTDDAMLVERLGRKVKIVQGSYENIKITTPDDLALAELILQRRGRE